MLLMLTMLEKLRRVVKCDVAMINPCSELNKNGPQKWCMVTKRAPVNAYKDDDQPILIETTSVNNNQLDKR